MKKATHCPICDSTQTSVFSNHNFYDFLSLLHCRDCGFFFTVPHRSYYPEDFSKNTSTTGADSLWWVPQAAASYTEWRNAENLRIVNVITEKCTLGKTLEIGFGEGPLTERIFDQCDDYWGIEPETVYFSSTCKRLKLDTSRVFRVGIEEIKNEAFFAKEAGTFDLIIMASVFEHLPYPEVILTTIHKLLKPGGKLFLSTPDSSNFKLFYMIRKFLKMEYWCSYHIGFFNPKNIEQLFNTCGFSVCSRASANLISQESTKYFGQLTGKKYIAFFMCIARLSRLDRVFKLVTLNYIIEKR